MHTAVMPPLLMQLLFVLLRTCCCEYLQLLHWASGSIAHTSAPAAECWSSRDSCRNSC
jgi:hypothetical protein